MNIFDLISILCGEDLWHKGVDRCILSVKKKCKTPTLALETFFFSRLQRLQHFKTMKLHLNFWYCCLCPDSNFYVSHHGQEHDSQTSPDVVEACLGRCRTSMTWKRKGWEPWHLGPKNVLGPKKRRGKSVGNYTQILRHTYIPCMHAHTQTHYIRIHCNKNIKLDLYLPVFQLLQSDHSWSPQLKLTWPVLNPTKNGGLCTLKNGGGFSVFPWIFWWKTSLPNLQLANDLRSPWMRHGKWSSLTASWGSSL